MPSRGASNKRIVAIIRASQPSIAFEHFADTGFENENLQISAKTKIIFILGHSNQICSFVIDIPNK